MKLLVAALCSVASATPLHPWVALFLATGFLALFAWGAWKSRSSPRIWRLAIRFSPLVIAAGLWVFRAYSFRIRLIGIAAMLLTSWFTMLFGHALERTARE